MPRYRYKAKNLDGKVFKGVMEAADEDALLKGLRFKGLYCMDYHSMESGTKLRPVKLKGKMLPPLCRQLAAMLAAGVPLSRALAVSYESSQDRTVKETLIKLRESVHKGRTLYEAMEEMPGAFPKLLVYMVQTGGASGTLDHMLERMAESYDREEELNGKVRTAMTYPVILFCITVIASVFMLTTVLPQFASMMEEQELPWITRLMMGVSISLRNYGLYYMILIMVFIALSMGVLMIPSVRLKADRAILHIPVIGKLLRTVETSRFASTFAVLYGSGVGILDAIHASGRVIGNTYVEKCLERAAENMKRGEMLSQVLKELDVFHPILISMVVAGEESGALDTVLSEAGGYYQREAGRALGQMVALLEPVMILFMALIVGSIVMAVMIPVFNMYSSML